MENDSVFGVGWDVLWLSIFALLVVFLVAALVSINKSSLDAVTKLVWAVLALLFPIIGPVVWFVYRSSNRSSVPPRTRAQQSQDAPTHAAITLPHLIRRLRQDKCPPRASAIYALTVAWPAVPPRPCSLSCWNCQSSCR